MTPFDIGLRVQRASLRVRGGLQEDIVATEGELVKMKNGRWARYRQVSVTSGGCLPTMLVAVELEPKIQALLDEAAAAFRSVSLKLSEALDGSFSVQALPHT